MICAALLHDTIEDTDVTYEDLKSMENGFGGDTAKMVLELTDISKPEDGNRAIRKTMDREHLSTISNRAKTIKLADLIHNSVSILKYDEKFSKVFMVEKRELLKVLVGGNEKLHAYAASIVNSYFKL